MDQALAVCTGGDGGGGACINYVITFVWSNKCKDSFPAAVGGQAVAHLLGFFLAREVTTFLFCSGSFRISFLRRNSVRDFPSCQ